MEDASAKTLSTVITIQHILESLIPPEDRRPMGDRDGSIAGVMEREVLAKHHRALMLFGINHIRHGEAAVGRYEARYPGVTFVIGDHHGFGDLTPLARYNDDLERRMSSWPVPSLVTMRGTWLDNLPAGYYDPDDATQNALGRVISLEGFPTTILLDRHCLIRAVWVGYRPGVETEMERYISTLLDEESKPPERNRGGKEGAKAGK